MGSPIPAPPPDASATKRGLVNLTTQTFAGLKTFAAGLVLQAKLAITTVVGPNHAIEIPSGARISFNGTNTDAEAYYDGTSIVHNKPGSFTSVTLDASGITGVGIINNSTINLNSSGGAAIFNIAAQAGGFMEVGSNASDSGGAITAVRLAARQNLTNAASKAVSWGINSATAYAEKGYITKDGKIVPSAVGVNAVALEIASQARIAFDGSTGSVYLAWDGTQYLNTPNNLSVQQWIRIQSPTVQQTGFLVQSGGGSPRLVSFRLAGGANELLQFGGDGGSQAPDLIQFGPSALSTPEVGLSRTAMDLNSGVALTFDSAKATEKYVAPAGSVATADGYKFATTSGVSLDPMVGATQVLNSGNDDSVATVANIGFTFKFEGVDYTQFTVSPDGWIKLGAQGSNEFSPAFSSTSNIPRLFPWWQDLATGTDGYVKTLLSGSAGSRILKIEWKVTIPRNTGGATNAQFQCWLYEGSNRIEFRYATTPTPTSNAIIGIRGAQNSSTVGVYKFISVNPATHAASNSVETSSTTWPGSGRMYVFVPYNKGLDLNVAAKVDDDDTLVSFSRAGTVGAKVLGDGSVFPAGRGVLSTVVAFSSTPYTPTAAGDVFFGNVNTGTVNLPDAKLSTGRVLAIKNLHATNLTVQPTSGFSQTIDGAASITLAQYAKAWLISDGSNWYTL